MVKGIVNQAAEILLTNYSNLNSIESIGFDSILLKHNEGVQGQPKVHLSEFVLICVDKFSLRQ